MPGGQYINHFNGVRARVTGTGLMEVKLISLDTTTNSQLTNIVLTSTNARFVNQLANFMQQKSQLEFKTTGLNDFFFLRQLLIYIKPIYTSFPQ